MLTVNSNCGMSLFVEKRNDRLIVISLINVVLKCHARLFYLTQNV